MLVKFSLLLPQWKSPIQSAMLPPLDRSTSNACVAEMRAHWESMALWMLGGLGKASAAKLLEPPVPSCLLNDNHEKKRPLPRSC
jgi:hypothetical protein